jgi:predicted DNA-binding protein (MmcQ/YjbR family)
MNVELIRNYCLKLKGVEEGLPFGVETLVFKVMGKIFLIIGLDNPVFFNVKCEPEIAIELRERHPEVLPGWHMNKQHWNSVRLDGDLDDNFIYEQIDRSYRLIADSLTKKLKEELGNL